MSDREQRRLTIVVVTCAVLSLVVAQFLSAYIRSEDHAALYLVASAVGFTMGFVVGWLTTRT